MNVHSFSGSTGSAYDETQCRDDIRSGDILVVEEEKVVGIMVAAWPTSVTVNAGKFEVIEPNLSVDDVCAKWTSEDADKEWVRFKPDDVAALAKAREVATLYGWACR